MTWEEPKTSWNLIVETKEGDPDNVVMLGAHLDSVPSGAGLNDNGSGVAAVFKVIHSISRHKGIKNKVRAAFWGAEE